MTINKHKPIIPLNDRKPAHGSQTERSESPSDISGKVNRREALLKASGYAAFTAAAMMAVLTPRQAVAASGYSTPAEAPTGNRSPGNRPSNPQDY